MKKLLLVLSAIVFLMCWSMATAGKVVQSSPTTALSQSPTQQVNIANKNKKISINNSKSKLTFDGEKSRTATERSAPASNPEKKIAPFVKSNSNEIPTFTISNTAPFDRMRGVDSRKVDRCIPAPPPDPNIILQGGDNMYDATVISSIPYVDSGSTAGYTHDFSLDCADAYNYAPDVFYSYTPASDGWITVATFSHVYFNSMLGILDDSGTQLACSDNYWTMQPQIANFRVTAGATYYIVVSGFEGSYGPYTLLVNGSPNCAFTIPEPNTPENEPDCYDDFIDDTNGGCNSTPNVFSTVSSGETIAGKAGTYLINGIVEARDTDWYTLTLDAPKVVHITGMAEFPLLIGLLVPPCPGLPYYFGTAGPCTELNINSTTLDPGEYWIVALPSVFSGVTCGSDYYFTVTVEDPPAAPANDLCENATPITGPYPQIVNGTTKGATADCPDYLGYNAAWYAINLPYEVNLLSINFCPTADQIRGFGYAFLNDCNSCDSYNIFYWTFPLCDNLQIQPELKQEIAGPTTIYYPLDLAEPMDYSFIIDVQEIIPPPNDNCVDVTPVPLELGVPLQFTGDNTGSTVDCQMHWDKESWVAFTTTEFMNITVDLCGTNPYFDNIYIILETNCPCDQNTLYANSWSRDLCDYNWSSTWLTVPPGTYYYPIYQWFDAEGPYVLNINSEACAPPPANDICADAEAIGEVVSQPFSTIGATYDGSSSCIFSPDIWYVYNATATAPVTVNLCGSSLDTKLAIYEGSSCPVAPDPPASVPLQGGEDIANATFIYDPLPVSYTGTTTGYINNHVSGCGFEGNDVIYSYLPLEDGTIDVDMCGTSLDTYIPALVILDDAATEIACAGDGCGLTGSPKLTGVPVESGRMYYVVITGWNNNEGGDYIVHISNSTFTLLECNDDFCDFQSQITFDANAGTQYLIQVGGYWQDVGEGVISISRAGGCAYVPGDANNSNSFNGLDVTYSVNYFKGGAAPSYSCECPPPNSWFVAGDVNGSCSFNGLDVTYMVNYFKGGAAPIPCADCAPAGLAPASPAIPPINLTEPKTY